MISQNNGTESPSDVETPQRHSQIPKPKPQAQPDLVNTSDSAAETPKRSEDSASTSATSNTDVDVRRQTVPKQPEYYHEAWHSDDQRGRAAPPADSGRTSRLFGHRRNPSSVSKQSTGETLSTPQRLSTKPDSPPLTGKDSAYSSVSGASGMSPTVASPRSASSVSSRQTAQFGLFPTRNLTPKGSISGRLGAMSPAFGQTSRSAKPVETPTASRPTTSISNYSDTSSSKRLSKRSSFSSLKRLFTKKRSGEIETIAE